MPKRCATLKLRGLSENERLLKRNERCSSRSTTYLLRHGVVAEDGLVAVPLLLELHVAEEHDAGDDLPDGVEVVLRHAHDAQRLHRRRELLGVVEGPHRHLILRQERVALRRLDDVLF